MRTSIIVPIYNEAENIPGFLTGLNNFLKHDAGRHEVVFIDDASVDTSLNLLKHWKNKYSDTKIISLPVRRGQLHALTQGVKMAKFDTIITVDADLQYDLHEIQLFIDKINSGYDAVSGVRRYRCDSLGRVLFSGLANFLCSVLNAKIISDLGCSFNGFKKSLFNKVLDQYGEEILINKSLLIKNSKKHTSVYVSHFPRQNGNSKNSLYDLCKLFMVNLNRNIVNLFLVKRFL